MMTRKFETTKTTLKDYLDAVKQAIRDQEEKQPELAHHSPAILLTKIQSLF